MLSADDAASLETEFELRLEMALEEVKSIEKEKAGEQAKFKESTAVFQPEYTGESAADGDQSRRCLSRSSMA